MIQAMAIASVALSLISPPTGDPAADPAAAPSDKITVGVVTINGSGCRAGTTALATAADNQAFTVTYSEYIAHIGAGASATDMRKNCQLMLKVKAPQGFTFAIAKADYRGFASLAKGATARQQASFYFQGDSATSSVSHSFAGPLEDNWQTTDTQEVAEMVWSPCGSERLLAVNTELRVNAGTSDPARDASFMTMDSTDGSVSTEYHLSWKTC